MGEMTILSGMLFCADCVSKLYQVHHRGWTHEQEIFIYAKHRKHKGMCTPHQIHNVQVEEILLRELRHITAYAWKHEENFIQLVTRHSEKELTRHLRDSTCELSQADERIGKLDGIIQCLYEDNVRGKISVSVLPSCPPPMRPSRISWKAVKPSLPSSFPPQRNSG